MTVQQAFDALKIFGDQATAGGLFKTVADAVTYKTVCDALVAHFNSQHEMILNLNQQLELREPVRPE